MMTRVKSTRLNLCMATALASGCGVVAVEADDWEQWRGAGRLGVWHERGIIESFPDDGLTVTCFGARTPRAHAQMSLPSTESGAAHVDPSDLSPDPR